MQETSLSSFRELQLLSIIGALSLLAPACSSASSVADEDVGRASAATVIPQIGLPVIVPTSHRPLIGGGTLPTPVDISGLDSQNGMVSGVFGDDIAMSYLKQLAQYPLRSPKASAMLNKLAETPTGVSLISHLARCVLSLSDAPLRVVVGGSAVSTKGGLALATSWLDAPLTDTSKQRWVTACLLAHANNMGEVPIAVSSVSTSSAPLPTSGSRWAYEEGAFFGNLFEHAAIADHWLFSCTGTSAVAYCGDRGASQDIKRRICGRKGGCGFLNVGPCIDVTGGRSTCSGEPYSSCSAGGVDYSEVITVSLQTDVDALSLHPSCAKPAPVPGCDHKACEIGAPLDPACAETSALCGGTTPCLVEDEDDRYEHYCNTVAWDSICVDRAHAAGACP